jgi:hypothetical protein
MTDQPVGGIRFAIPRCGLPQLAHVNVDVEIDLADAGLLLSVRPAFVPPPIARTGIFDIGKPEALPLRQRTAALSGERHASAASSPLLLVPMMCGHNSRWRIGTNYLLFSEDRLAE